MDFLKKLFKDKDKKAVSSFMLMLGLGVVLLLGSNILFKGPSNLPVLETAFTEADAKEHTEDFAFDSYEAELERRLEETLTLVNGAGEIKVMVTLRQSKELVLANNSTYDSTVTKETDSQGGIRESESIKKEEEIILINGGGGDRPLILTENTPKIEGIIIVAQGGDNVIVKDSLTRAAQVILGLDVNKIQVLKMR